jgi:hypothetical protein
MHASIRLSLAAAVVGLLAILPRAAAGQTVTTGSISGVVKGAQGESLPGVTVTATSLSTGLTRESVTEADGAYTVTLLPPGNYRVDATLGGLGKATQGNVAVLLGNSTKADLSITPQIAEQVSVTAATPVVDVARAATANSVTSEQIANLPILGRDFKSLAALTPGVNEAFGGRITADGARGLATDFNIDGATSNNDFFGENTGGTRAPFTFSQAAIQEFQVVRSQYDAEFGRGVGAQLNAITKSGTNNLHGETFFFRRAKSWVAPARPTTLDNGQTVVDSFLPKGSTQPGFVVGGPLVHDKAFFLLNYDGQRQKQPNVITDLRVRSDFLKLSTDQQTQVINKISALIGHPYTDELGYDTTFNQNTYLAKVDGNLGRKSRVSLRDNYTNFENGNNQSLGNLSNQGIEHDKFNQLVGQGNTVFNGHALNDALFEYSTDERPVTPIASTPEIQISAFSPSQFFGQNDFLPNNTKERKYELKDTVRYTAGTHELKAGTDLLFMHIDNLFPRRLNGIFQYSTVDGFLSDSPSSLLQGYGAGGGLTSWNQNTYAFFVADTFRPSARLTIDAGVRYDWQTMPLPATNVYPQHPEFITNIKEDKNNIAPRLGAAYDLMGNGRSVIRAGIGKFFGYMPDILLSNPLTQISGNFNQVTVTCGTGAIACPTYPALLTPDQFNTLAKTGTDVVTVSPDYQAQESWRGSAQFEKQIGHNYSAAIGGVFANLTHVQGSRNINAVPAGISLGNLPLYVLQSPNRLYTDMGVVRELCSCETASYKSLTIETHRLALNSSRFSWDLSYTFASSIDEDTNERSTSSSFLYDPFNPALSRGPSDNDVRHRISAGGIYHLPFGFMAAGIFTWHTGTPYTEGILFSQSGVPGVPTSLSGLSQTTGNIPVFVDRNGSVIDLTQVNGFTQQQFSDFLASQGATIQGRNRQRQPRTHNIDARLSKTFDFRHGMHVELLAEVFNLLNTRITAVSSNQNLARLLYTQSTGKYTVQQSFATTVNLVNAYVFPDPRQVQVAAKFRF